MESEDSYVMGMEEEDDVLVLPSAAAAPPLWPYGLPSDFPSERVEEGAGAMAYIDLASSDLSDGAAPAGPAPQVGKKRSRQESRSDKRKKMKNWRFTWNNPAARPESWKGWSYLVYQREIAPTTGTVHYQGYVQMEQRKTFEQMRKMAPLVHWLSADKSPRANDDYCSKEETRDPRPDSGPWRFGKMSVQGARNDLGALAERVLAGSTLGQIAREDPEAFVRYSRGLQALSRYQDPPPIQRDVKVSLFIGPTGTGKTYAATVDCGFADRDVYIKPTGKWFDNYIGQPYVVLDDMAGAASAIPLAETLRMLDGYRFQAEVKNNYEWFRATKVVVTTNIHPMNWYSFDRRVDQYWALARRFHEVRVFYGGSSTSSAPGSVTILPGTRDWQLFFLGVSPHFMCRADGEKNNELAARLEADIAALE